MCRRAPQLKPVPLGGGTMNPVTTEHPARITWSSEQVRLGLPAIASSTDPVWLDTDSARSSEGWSLVCRFEAPPLQQGNPSIAQVRFMMAGAPHEQLSPGVTLRMFERATGQLATVEILE